ncbi:MAG: winged helix-turn-helix domain-containing protein [Candidatus Bathyarchaeota archaeon]|nr:winged helix-turn-helix domain-containing protein [Candidatus Bathyarchaeota archaeon]
MQALELKRNRIQLLNQILNICQHPQTPTAIMQKADLTKENLDDCIMQLQDLGFLFFDVAHNEYLTTAKGQAFLGKWRQFQELLKPNERCLFKIQTEKH